MTTEALLTVGREALLLMVLASMPPVLAGLVVGVGMGLLQAVTQVQETDALRRAAAVRRAARAGGGLSVDRRAAAPVHRRAAPGRGVGPVTRLLAEVAEAVRPELLAWAIASMRVLPLSLLCPVLGGRLRARARCGSRWRGTLGLALRPLAGGAPPGALEALVRCGREAAVGLVVGIGAALPFDAARIGGRLIDLVRGTSAEAALPVAGHHESATGDVLHQLLVSLALAGGALPVLVHALARSYVLVPAGSTLAGDGPLAVARLVGVALATGLAVAAPVVALSWATDAAVGIVLRAAPGLPANGARHPGPHPRRRNRALAFAAAWSRSGCSRWVLSPGGWLLEVLGP